MEPIMEICIIICIIIALAAVIFFFLYKRSKAPSHNTPEQKADEISSSQSPNMEDDVDDGFNSDEFEDDSNDSNEEPEDDTEMSEDEDNDVEVSRPSGDQLTEYMDYLNIVQLMDYDVFRVKEKYISASQPNSVEILPAFLFTVFKSDEMLLLIYETTKTGRNTLLFTVEESQYEKAYKAVIRYFQSNRVNKRKNLSSYMKYLKRSGVIMCSSRQHNDLDSWKTSLHWSPRKMIRDLVYPQ